MIFVRDPSGLLSLWVRVNDFLGRRVFNFGSSPEDAYLVLMPGMWPRTHVTGGDHIIGVFITATVDERRAARSPGGAVITCSNRSVRKRY